MIKMTKNRNLIVWCVIYFIFAFAAFRTSVLYQGLDFQEFIDGNLFTIQKYYFDISIVFISFLYVIKKPFESVFFMTRCKEFHLFYVIVYGIKGCLFYIGYTVVLFVGFPILYGLPLVYNSSLFFDFLNLFSFIFTIYLFYLFILLLTGKQMLAVLSSYFMNAPILMLSSLLEMIDSSMALQLETFLLTSYMSIAMVMLALVFLVFRKRDFLL